MVAASPSELYFRCPACRNRLAVPGSEAGRLLDCPACRSSLMVPAQSTAWPPGRARTLGIIALQVACALVLAGFAWSLMRPGDEPARALADAGSRSRTVPQAGAGPVRPAPVPVRAAGEPEPADDQAYRELRSAHRALNRQYEELANWVLNNMRGRFLLKEKFVRNINLPPLTDEYLVHPDLVEFLEVTPQERDLLDDALGFGLSTMALLETKFLSVTQSAADRVALHIPPYQQEGAALQNDLYRAMETVLGSDRFGRLLDAGEPDLVKRYHYFGTASRTMVFQETPAQDPRDPPYLVIRDGWIIPDGVGKRNIQVAEASVRELPRDFLPYLSWLPDFVAAYARP